MAKKRRALLLGYYGANNLGDDMMLHCILPWLHKQDLEVTVVSEAPAETAQRFNTGAVPNVPMLGQWNWKATLLRGGSWTLFRQIRDHDILVVGGGDLIRDDKGWKTFSYTMEKIVLALLVGRPVYMVNVGINDPITSYGRIVLQWALRRTKQVITRDQRTFNLCKHLAGVKVSLLPDIVVTLPSVFEVGSNPAETKPYIIVSLREDPDAFHQYPFSQDHTIALAKALDRLSLEQDIQVVFVPFHGGGSHDDNALHQQVAASMKEKARVVVREWTSDLAEVVTWITHARMVLGMRLHAIVLAIGCRRPCFAMPYDHKIYEFADLVKLKEFVTSDQLLDTEFTVKALSRLCRSAADYDLRRAQQWESLRLQI